MCYVVGFDVVYCIPIWFVWWVCRCMACSYVLERILLSFKLEHVLDEFEATCCGFHIVTAKHKNIVIDSQKMSKTTNRIIANILYGHRLTESDQIYSQRIILRANEPIHNIVTEWYKIKWQIWMHRLKKKSFKNININKYLKKNKN